MYFHCCREGLWLLSGSFFLVFFGKCPKSKALLASKNYLRNLWRDLGFWESQFGDTNLIPGYFVLYKYRWWAKLNLCLFLVSGSGEHQSTCFAVCQRRHKRNSAKVLPQKYIGIKIHIPTHQQGHDDGIVWLWWWTAQVNDVYINNFFLWLGKSIYFSNLQTSTTG